METTIGIEQAILFAGAMISHLCIVIGAFATSNHVKVNQKRHSDCHDTGNATDGPPENTALIELFRFGLIAVCCISFSWLIVVIGFFALR